MLPAIEDGSAPRLPQDEAMASYAPMIRKEEARVDFSKNPCEICALIRAMNPSPGAFARMGETAMKLHTAIPSPKARPAPYGTVISVSDDGLLVAAGAGGAVLVTVIQAPGKRPMRVAEYLRGAKPVTGAVFT
jgi:methionyl-tRNA formyltransferase